MESSDLQKQFPISSRRILRRSAPWFLLALLLDLFVLIAYSSFKPKSIGLSTSSFILVAAGIILVSWVLVLGRLIYEVAAFLLVRYSVVGNTVYLGEGLSESFVEKMVLSPGCRISVWQSFWDRIFSLANLSISVSRGSAALLSVRGLGSSDAPQLRDRLLARVADQTNDITVPKETRVNERGEGNMTSSNATHSKAEIERLNSEKAELDRQKQRAEKELENLKSKAEEREALELAEAEKLKAAEALEKTNAELEVVKTEQKEGEQLEQTKKDLSKARQKLEMLREEKQAKEELSKVKDEIVRESQSSADNQGAGFAQRTTIG